MTVFTRTWNTAYEAIPADNDDALEGALRIRNLKKDVRERLEVDHSYAGDSDDGYHKKLTLLQQGSAPTNITDSAILYTKDVGGSNELFVMFDDGTEEQLTGSGRLLLDGTNNSDSFIRSDASDSVSGALTFTGAMTLTNQKLTLNGVDDNDFIRINVTDDANAAVVQFAGSGAVLGEIDFNPTGEILNIQGFGAVRIDGNAVYHQGNREIPVGTQMLFYQANAPTGWTKVTTVNDRLVRVVSGTGAGTGGAWSVSGLTVGDTALTVNQLPAHTHSSASHQHDGVVTDTKTAASASPEGAQVVSGNNERYLPGDTDSAAGGNTGSTGSGATHTHSISSNGNWRPAYVNMIICSKDS